VFFFFLVRAVGLPLGYKSRCRSDLGMVDGAGHKQGRGKGGTRRVGTEKGTEKQ
jgi:hypothetical protein